VSETAEQLGLLKNRTKYPAKRARKRLAKVYSLKKGFLYASAFSLLLLLPRSNANAMASTPHFIGCGQVTDTGYSHSGTTVASCVSPQSNSQQSISEGGKVQIIVAGSVNLDSPAITNALSACGGTPCNAYLGPGEVFVYVTDSAGQEWFSTNQTCAYPYSCSDTFTFPDDFYQCNTDYYSLTAEYTVNCQGNSATDWMNVISQDSLGFSLTPASTATPGTYTVSAWYLGGQHASTSISRSVCEGDIICVQPINLGGSFEVSASTESTTTTSTTTASTTSPGGPGTCMDTVACYELTPTQPGGDLGPLVFVNTGVTVDIAGTTSSGPINITTTDDGSTAPAAGADVNLGGASGHYFDVQVVGATDGTATVCISPSNGATTMDYYNDSMWNSAFIVLLGDELICGVIPVAALNGTPIAIDSAVITSTTSSSSSSMTSSSSSSQSEVGMGVPQFPASYLGTPLLVAAALLATALLRRKKAPGGEHGPRSRVQ
jgi:hypothetical protein